MNIVKRVNLPEHELVLRFKLAASLRLILFEPLFGGAQENRHDRSPSEVVPCQDRLLQEVDRPGQRPSWQETRP